MGGPVNLTYFKCPICHKWYLDCHDTDCDDCKFRHDGFCDMVDSCEHDPDVILSSFYAETVQLREELDTSLAKQDELLKKIDLITQKHQWTNFHKLYGSTSWKVKR